MKKVKFITILFIILPLLSIYKSFIYPLSLADLAIMIIAILSVIDTFINKSQRRYLLTKEKKYIHFAPLLFIILMIFTTLLSILVNGEVIVSSVIIRILRYALFMYSVSVIGYKYFDSNYGAKLIVTISIVSTVYIFIQTIVYYSTGVVLPFIIPFFDPVVSDYNDISGLIAWYNQFYYRPQSFFMEPAHFSQYNLVSLALCLFWKEKFSEQNRIKTAIFLSIGLVLSTSSIGVILGLFIWSIYLMKSYRNKITHKKIVVFILMFFVLIILSPTILETQRITVPIVRVFQTTARTTDSISLFEGLNIKQKILGIGLGNEEVYLGIGTKIPFMNALTIVLLSAGYIGIFAYLILFLSLFLYKKGLSKVLVISLFILSFGSEVFFTYTGILWMLFIYYWNWNFNFSTRLTTK